MANKFQSFELEDENSKSGGETTEFTTDDECTGQRARRQVKGKLQDVDINVQKIMSTNKSESMFELRKLTHHQQPVSAFNSKQTLEKCLSSRQPPSHEKPVAVTTPQHTNGDPSLPAEAATQPSAVQESSLNVSERVQLFIPSPEPNPQTLRPDEVRLEMQNLMERQIVHEVLQGPAQEIDRALREGMEQRQARRRTRSRPHQHVPQVDDGDEGGDEMGQGSAHPVGRLLSSSRASAAGRRGRSSRSRHVRFVPQPPTPNAEGRYPVPRRDQSVIVDRLRQSPALNSLGDEARDDIVAEVSSLVSQQLVTSALSGEFRGVLELHIQSRAQRIDSGHVIGPGHMMPSHYQERDNLDEDRESLPSAQIRELREDMMSMRGQLSELKQMVKLSFELQLDIQRAIRQEVAAALAGALSQQSIAGGGQTQVHTCPLPTLGRTSSLTNSHGGVNVVDSGHCVICSEGVIDSVIYHCGHMSTCIACGLELKSKRLKCPICRAPITDVIRAYTSML